MKWVTDLMMTEMTEEVRPEDKGLKRGILVRGIGSFYTVRDGEKQEYTLRCKKKFRHERITPLVGDEVLFSPGQGEEHGWLEEILPRKTVCLRPPVANVTRLVIVAAPVPEPDLLLVDRQVSRAFSQGMDVLMIANKQDLDETLAQKLRDESYIRISEIAGKVGYEDPAYFSKSFFRETGMTPREYRTYIRV